jgi:primosomal protein N' (replication factor Y)
VIGFVPKPDVPQVKDIIDICFDAPLFNESSVKLAKWMSEYYVSYFISALRTVMPPGIKRSEGQEKGDAKGKKRRAKSAGAKAEEKAKIKIEQPLTPTPHQKSALNIILPVIEAGRSKTVLLFGVTGSGKTEVYLQAAARALELGRSSIILVPEVALTSHLMERFEGRFGEHLTIFHSEMTMSARQGNWLKVASGSSKVILGTRSAIFAPAWDLGLIVIDEEYETTYKQEQSPRYQTREVAQFLSKGSGAVLVLGSATPSMETFYRSEIGEYERAELPERIDGKALPPVEIVDLNSEKRYGALSEVLKSEIRGTLNAGHQVILFINRRGYFTTAVCGECGDIVRCPKCSVPLVTNLSAKKMSCTHCNFTASSTIICPKCQSSSILFTGIGTQRIEQEVSSTCPGAKIVRIDRDTTEKKGSSSALFSSFASGAANVLIGTQLVTKGLDLPSVTLVGVVSADTSLNFPDLRSGEHTFQLLTQVAGRAGRHSLPGKVIVQTYNPDHYAIRAAAAHDYRKFYNEEMVIRKKFRYPPFCRLINIVVSGGDENEARSAANETSQILKPLLSKGDEALGPSPAPIFKVRGLFRFQLLLKGDSIDALRKAVVDSLQKVVLLPRVRVTVDVDPVSMM